MKTKRCIIIPAYNEAENICAVINAIKKYYTQADIIIIDDGSQDDTVQKAGTAGVLVLRHPFNMGYGVALQTGYKYACQKKYDFLLQIDGDGQHNPRHIPEFFKQIENNHCDVMVGSRFLGAGNYEPGFLKFWGIQLFRFIIKVINRETITDPTSGYQCMNDKVINFFTDDSFPCDYPDANIIIMLHRMGFIVRELPVLMVPNPEGRSMHSGLFTITYYFFKVFLSIFITLIREQKVP